MGGTLFLGRAIADQAIAAGHTVTLFNRGMTNPTLYLDTGHILADWDSDLALLRGRAFDAVIDTSGYFPRQVAAVADALRGELGHYTFISSASAYADQSTPGADETAALATVADPAKEGLGENHGGFKALCEAALGQRLPGRVHRVRAGLIVGPNDNTGRFSYWVKRIAEGGEVWHPNRRIRQSRSLTSGTWRAGVLALRSKSSLARKAR